MNSATKKLSNKTLTLTIISILLLSVFVVLVQIPTAKATTYYQAGYTSIFADGSQKDAGLAWGEKIAITESANVSLLSIWTANSDAGSMNLKAEIFNYSGGAPTTSIWNSSAVEVTGATKQWINFTISPSLIFSADDYFVSFSTDYQALFNYSYGGYYAEKNVAYISFPINPFGTPSYTDDMIFNAFLTYSIPEAPLTPENPIVANTDYNFTIAQNSTSNYVIAKNQSIMYNNVIDYLAFNTALGYLPTGGSIYTNTGTYTLNSSITANNVDNITMAFNSSALLYADNALNAPVILTINCDNWSFENVTISGNAENQVAGAGNALSPNGISIRGGSNVLIDNATIYNCRVYGIIIWAYSTFGDAHDSGVTNSDVYNCGWNSITVGDLDNYVTNCNIYGSSDVGVSLYGVSTLVNKNYIHDLNGTTGGGGNAKYGVATEGDVPAYSLITNNTCLNLGTGVFLNQGYNIVTNNSFTNCNNTVVSATVGYDTITRNTITNWGYGAGYYPSGVLFDNSDNNIVSFNIFSTSNTDWANYGVIVVGGSVNSSICNNTITMTMEGYGVYVDAGTDNLIIEGNTIQCDVGIRISDATCDNNKLNQNLLGSCNTEISDIGTGTIINPSSCNTYTLTLNNPYDGSAIGTYVYSNTTQRILTTSGVLNVNGVNVTSPYTISMNADHFVYVLGGSATITSSSISLTYFLGVPMSEWASYKGISFVQWLKINGVG
jgi:hypothetical protein